MLIAAIDRDGKGIEFATTWPETANGHFRGSSLQFFMITSTVYNQKEVDDLIEVLKTIRETFAWKP